MYCIRCGVEMSDGAKKCPLCETPVFNPCLPEEGEKRSYPPFEKGEKKVSRKAVMFILTFLVAIPFVLCLMIDLQLHHGIQWSGYVMGGILLLYLIAFLPAWFRAPNPVIFVPCDFAGILLYLLYIDLATGGAWFLSFAFPVTLIFASIICAVIALVRYVRGGYLYIFGGAIIGIGIFCVFLEFFLNITFSLTRTFLWSLYPLAACFILGMMLIIIAICKPLRISLSKKFFL